VVVQVSEVESSLSLGDEGLDEGNMKIVESILRSLLKPSDGLCLDLPGILRQDPVDALLRDHELLTHTLDSPSFSSHLAEDVVLLLVAVSASVFPHQERLLYTLQVEVHSHSCSR
jgi:hypothetical protein